MDNKNSVGIKEPEINTTEQTVRYERLPSKPVKGKLKFIPGLKLNRMFFEEVVKPLMQKYFPELSYSAALTGHGSDSLGFDSPRSTDHNWGPHLIMFFRYSDYGEYAPKVDTMLRKCLPYTFRGYSTNFSQEDPEAYLKQVPIYINEGDVNHLFSLFTIRGYLKHYLAFDRDRDISLYDWLTFPEQNLVEVTSGEVFYDGLNEVIPLRNKFKYYPDDIWLYALRVQWGRMHLMEQFQARTGENKDEVGSRIAAAKMVDEIVATGFLLERTHAPYHKWEGTAFRKLKVSKKLLPLLNGALTGKNWKIRQDYITKALYVLGQTQNRLKITVKQPLKITDFHGRGYTVFDMKPFIQATQDQIKDPKIRGMKYMLGRIDQFMDHPRISLENYVFRHMQDLIA
jgi:hypothetical protein